MDWVERLFGVSPDGGSGLIEIVITVVAASAVAIALWVRRYAAIPLPGRQAARGRALKTTASRSSGGSAGSGRSRQHRGVAQQPGIDQGASDETRGSQ